MILSERALQPVMDQVAEVAGEFGVPILFHDGTPPFSLPSQMAPLAQRHPLTKFILGHSGLFEHFREAAAAVNACENLWACLCGPLVQGLRHLRARVTADIFLWGTDFGDGLADVFAYRAALTDLLGLSDGQRQAMFQDNLASLLRLERQT